MPCGGWEKALSADPYKVLGVTKDASQEDIQKAYRALAKKLHPDLNPGNKKAEEQFKEVSAAYDLVGDAEKRARFDRGEIDASGAERPPRGFYRDHAGGAGDHYASADGFADFAGADDIFADLFGRGGRTNLRMRGQNAHYRLELDFLDAVNGAKRQLTMPDGSFVYSITNTLTVLASPPVVTLAGIPIWNTNQIVVVFDHAVDPTTAATAGTPDSRR